MSLFAVVKTGGKQYLVKEGDEIVVDNLSQKEKDTVKLETLAVFDEKGDTLNLGVPKLDTSIEARVMENFKGEKIRVAKFKAKVRYRRVQGFRPQLTKLKIEKIVV